MKKEGTFYKIWNFPIKILAKVGFFFWSVETRIVFRGRIIYKDRATKEKTKGSCIYIANHTNHNDGFFIPQMLRGRKINVLVTTKWYNKKKYNWLFRNLRYIPIDLKTNDASWMEVCKEKMEKGESILIFPEGIIERSGVIEPFQPGFLLLARHVEAPIIPLAVTDPYRSFHRQRIVVGKEIAFDVHRKGRLSALLKEGAELCEEQVRQLLVESNASNPTTFAERKEKA